MQNCLQKILEQVNAAKDLGCDIGEQDTVNASPEMRVVSDIASAFFSQTCRKNQEGNPENISRNGKGDEEELNGHFGTDRDGRKDNGRNCT